MSTLHIAWVRMTQGDNNDGLAQNFIKQVVSAESVTVGAVSVASTAKPSLAMEAICHSVDADMYVTTDNNITPTASPTAGVFLRSGEKAYLTPENGHKIAAIEV